MDHPGYGIPWSLWKGDPATCCNEDEPPGHCAEWTEPVTKRQILYESTHRKCLKQSEAYKQSRLAEASYDREWYISYIYRMDKQGPTE